MSDSTEKVITVRLTSELHEKAKTKFAKGGSFQGLVAGWLQEWVGGGKITAMPERKTSSATHDRWHAMLSEILASGDKEAIDAIQYNLRVFHRVKKSVRKG